MMPGMSPPQPPPSQLPPGGGGGGPPMQMIGSGGGGGGVSPAHMYNQPAEMDYQNYGANDGRDNSFYRGGGMPYRGGRRGRGGGGGRGGRYAGQRGE